MSDADYTAFLDKANQDTGSASAQQQQEKKGYGTKSVNTEVPEVLQNVQEYYVSDADEPFEPVSLAYDGEGEILAGMFPVSLLGVSWACAVVRHEY
jgi:hypothetical protein